MRRTSTRTTQPTIRRTARSIGTLLLVMATWLLPVALVAAAPAASFSSPSSVRAGDTITVSFRMNGTGLLAVQGEIQYSSTQLTFRDSGGVLSGWGFDEDDSSIAGKFTFLISDQKQDSPINSTSRLFSLTFQVRSGVKAGDAIRVTAAELVASDGNTDFYPPNVSATMTVLAPLSTNANLSRLTVSNATLSPDFAKNTTSYSASVPFSVNQLDLTATPEDSKAKVAVGNNRLVAGGTTDVTVTVTAESGATKVYTIRVDREQDPDYKPSTDNRLATLQVEGFLLSPPFDAGVEEYVVWLPYEVDQVAINAQPADTRASVQVLGGVGLAPGQDNQVRVVCTAEDGTARTYLVIARRASSHDEPGATPTPPPDATPTGGPTGEPTGTPTDSPTPQPTSNATPIAREGPPLPAVLGYGLAGFSILAGIGGTLLTRRKER